MTLSDYRRAVDQGQSVAYFSQVASASEYYPPVGGHGPVFGMLLTDGNYSSGSYRFGFNGKEMDNDFYGEGNIYDYGFRIYNPRIAKFLSVDLLSASYPWYSPYTALGDNPVYLIDPDGNVLQVSEAKEGGIDKFKTMVSLAFDGKVYVEVAKNGVVTFHRVEGAKFTKLEEAAFNELKKVEDSDYVAHVNLTYDDEDLAIADFYKSKIDVSDIQSLGNDDENGPTARSVIVHEAVEQLQKAKWESHVGKIDSREKETGPYKDYYYRSSHIKACEAESRVSVYKIDGKIDGGKEIQHGDGSLEWIQEAELDNGKEVEIRFKFDKNWNNPKSSMKIKNDEER